MKKPEKKSLTIQTLVFGLFGLLSFSWVLHTLSRIYAVGIRDTSFMARKLDDGFTEWSGWGVLIAVHATAASLAIVTAVFAMLLAKRTDWRLHRRLGLSYVGSVLVSALAGFPIALSATGGIASTLGFIVLNSFWILSVVILYRQAKLKRIRGHRSWAIRSFATTMANTTLTILSVALGSVLSDETLGYQASIWLCLPLNLAVAELWLRSPPGRSKQPKSKHWSPQ